MRHSPPVAQDVFIVVDVDGYVLVVDVEGLALFDLPILNQIKFGPLELPALALTLRQMNLCP